MHFDFEIIYFASMTMSTVAMLFAWLTDDARLTLDAIVEKTVTDRRLQRSIDARTNVTHGQRSVSLKLRTHLSFFRLHVQLIPSIKPVHVTYDTLLFR